MNLRYKLDLKVIIRLKIVAHWARLLSMALITREMRVTESVHKLHIMVNKNICKM
jgi:hypothetical protein